MGMCSEPHPGRQGWSRSFQLLGQDLLQFSLRPLKVDSLTALAHADIAAGLHVTCLRYHEE